MQKKVFYLEMRKESSYTIAGWKPTLDDWGGFSVHQLNIFKRE